MDKYYEDLHKEIDKQIQNVKKVSYLEGKEDIENTVVHLPYKTVKQLISDAEGFGDLSFKDGFVEDILFAFLMRNTNIKVFDEMYRYWKEKSYSDKDHENYVLLSKIFDALEDGLMKDEAEYIKELEEAVDETKNELKSFKYWYGVAYHRNEYYKEELQKAYDELDKKDVSLLVVTKAKRRIREAINKYD